jgi:hypothetical protein
VTINVRSASVGGNPFSGVVAPSGVLSGDLLLAIQFGSIPGGSTDAAMTGPTGFVQVGSTYSDNDTIIKVWQAPGSTTAPYTFPGITGGAAGVLAIDQANAVTPIDVPPCYNSGTSLDAQVAPSVVPDASAFLLICGWCSTQGGTQGYSPAWDMTEQTDFNNGSTPFTSAIDTQVYSDLFSYAFQPTGTKCVKPTGTQGSTKYAAVTLVIAP